MSSIKELTGRFYDEMLPECTRLKEDADRKILAKRDEILGGLVQAIRVVVPEGKWKEIIEMTFSFNKPSEEEENEKKVLLWEVLEDKMKSIMGMTMISFSFENIKSAGFESWKEFLDSTAELEEKTKEVFVLHDFFKDQKDHNVEEDQKVYSLIFSVTCMPREMAERQRSILMELTQK